MKEELMIVYEKLHAYFGPQGWWPGETAFEVIIGAILTQNTNWNNVSKAIDNLRGAGILSYEKMSALPVGLLAEYIRPAGYYNIKAARLNNLFTLIREQYDNDLEQMLEEETVTLREALLSVKGIGRETADSILLYAAKRPVFVVDAYTYRVLVRHNLIPDDFGYEDMQQLFMDSIEPDHSHYNEYHALLVCVGKEFCKKSNPRCTGCPLEIK